MAHFPSAVRPIVSGQTATPISPLILPNKTTYPSKIMRCDVVFGLPSMDCSGTGICKIEISSFNQPLQTSKRCQLTFGLVSAGPGGKISIYFFREFLCIRLYRQHFRKGVLSMKEACPISSEISKGLNFQGTKILTGKYALVECNGFFRVDMNCG